MADGLRLFRLPFELFDDEGQPFQVVVEAVLERGHGSVGAKPLEDARRRRARLASMLAEQELRVYDRSRTLETRLRAEAEHYFHSVVSREVERLRIERENAAVLAAEHTRNIYFGLVEAL